MSKKQQDLFQTTPEPWELDDQDDWMVARTVFSAPPFGPYDYRIPPQFSETLRAGMRIRVPLGRGNRTMEGYCIDIIRPSDEKAMEVNPSRLKDLIEVVDSRSLINAELLQLASWISRYYVCQLGPTIDAIVPNGVREKSGTREVLFLSLSPEFEPSGGIKLTKVQQRIVDTLRSAGQPLTTSELSESATCTAGPINLLRKKGVIASTTRRVWQKDHTVNAELAETAFVPNPDQKHVLDQVDDALSNERYETFLIHGITGSGKTEVYIQAIEQVIGYGRQAIVLVPEISLTPQTRRRFRARFERVAVLHSHMTPAERAWHWKEIADGQIQVVIGARSAIFAPLPNLGLVVIDEEHDASFKQDNNPRYHARDVALWRAKHRKIPLLLGSATPALESWAKAIASNTTEAHRFESPPADNSPAVTQQDTDQTEDDLSKFTLSKLPRRVLNRSLPDVATIDLRTEFQNRSTRGAVSRQLHSAIHQSLKEDGQVILLLNRRGFSTSIQCPACGHCVHCPDCSIPMTHHREGQKIVCHYCDHQSTVPLQCPECRFADIRFAGFGTQKLELEIKARFPNTTCTRMDTDTMQRPGAHEKALDEFKSGKTQILLGTQMIAKGLDFPNVTLVGVINADTALHFPDFRAAERTFQLVTQVAGRSGRGDKGGRVLVQTFSPDHPAIIAATMHDFEKFATFELLQRKEHDYPPFGKLARAVIRGENEILVQQFSERLVKEIAAASEKNDLGVEVMGPAPAPVEKLRGKFRYHCLLQMPMDKPELPPFAVQDMLFQIQKKLDVPDEIQWIVDIDPSDML